MEHEDKAQNFLHENLSEFSLQQQNQQNFFENLQNASGFGARGVGVGGIGGIGDEIAMNLGGKFEEEHDEELKYINEVQQSEKQAIKKVGEEIVGFGNSVGDGGVGIGQLLEMAAVEVEDAAEKLQSMLDTDEMLEIHNSPSIDESSLATTTNNSSSENFEENVLPQQEHKVTATAPQLGLGDFLVSSSTFDDHHEYNREEEKAVEEDDKENADPTASDTLGDAFSVDTHLEDLPRDLDVDDMHSNLNPEAKEFVPTFSNPATPTSPKLDGDVFLNFAGEGEQQQHQLQQTLTAIETEKIQTVSDCLDVDFNVGEPVQADDPTSPHPTAVPRHLFDTVAAVDDFVAESPRKGRGADMDTIPLPAENEFDDGADNRPHELEKQEEPTATSEDNIDFQQSTTPVSIIDHGPETSVDLDVDVDIDNQDVIRKSLYVENQNESLVDQPIEDLLNTVQPIPTDSDSINNSFAEDYQQQQFPIQDEFLNKELLNIEEKENISHSPSTEELQMQFQTNDFSSSSKDIPAIPIDFDNAKDMEESMYFEHTSIENAVVETPLLAEAPIPATAELELLSPSPLPQQQQVQLDDSLLHDTSYPINDHSLAEHVSSFTNEAEAADAEAPVATAPEHLLFTDFTNEKVDTELVTPSPNSTAEEKHLLEETKENFETYTISGIEQQMSDLHIQKDEPLAQLKEGEKTSTPIEKEVPHQNLTFDVENREGNQILQERIEEDMAKENDNQKNIEIDQVPIESTETPAEIYTPEPQVSNAGPEALIAEPEALIAEPEALIAEPVAPVAEAVASIAEDVAPFAEPVAAPISEPEAPIAEPVSEPIAEIATVGVVAATAAAAVAAAAISAAGSKKPESAKKSTPGKVTSTTTKSKVSSTDAKKTTETKKPTAVSVTKSSTVTTAARPRTVPIKTATEKKTTTTTTSTTKPSATGSSTSSTTVRKHVTSTSVAAAKPAGGGAKTTATTTTTKTANVTGVHKTTGTTVGASRNGVSTVTAKTTASTRPSTATAATARKAATTTASKPRPATAGAAAPPTKPNTLGINAATNKPTRTSLSPRTTLTSQLRKTAGGPTSSVSNTATAAAKSPMKPTTNGIAGKVSSSISATTSAGNRKTTTTTTTTTTKTLTARPTPKTTTTTTTRLHAVGTNAAVGNNSLGAANASNISLRKSSSPSKRSTTSSSTASGKLSPTKAPIAAANAKNKTKDATKATKTIAITTTTKTTVVGASGDHATPLTVEMLKEKQQQFNANIMGVVPPQSNGSGATGDQINVQVVEHFGNGENGNHHHDHEENGHLIEQAEIALM